MSFRSSISTLFDIAKFSSVQLRNAGGRNRRLYSASFAVLLVVSALSFSLTACNMGSKKDPRAQTSMVSIEGSDTMDILLTAWRKAFMKENPEIPVSVTSADSGQGIAALLDKTTDIAAASRDMSAEERKRLHDKGMKVNRAMVALDSIAIIVNKENPVDEITIANLRKIYSGEITDWGDLGGKTGEKIVVLNREKQSGTFRYFTEHVMKRIDDKVISFSEGIKVMTSNEAMLAGVDTSENAIGYCGLSIALGAGAKTVSVKLLSTSSAVKPTLDSISRDYPLSRPLYLFYDQDPKPTVKQFVDYCLSAEGQKIVKEKGYLGIK